MSLLTRKRALLAKIETEYGTDPEPTAGANAMLVGNLDVQPLTAELVQRQIIKPYLGNAETLVAASYATASFEVEMVASGVVGKVPAFDSLMRACAFESAATTSAVTITRTSTTATATLNSHGYQVGDKVTISGATEPEYNGEQTITARDANTFSYTVSGTPDTPATGSPVVTTARVYTPVSEDMESVTLYFYNDQVLHKLTGARGTFEMVVDAKTIPSFRFTMTGLYNDAEDDEVTGTDFTDFMKPQVSNTDNTPAFSLFSYSGALQSLNVNMANEVIYRTLIGAEDVRIVDRKPEGTFLFEAPLIATKDFFDIAKSGTLGAMTLTQGSNNGYKVKIDAPVVSIGNPSYQDQDGVQMLSVPFTLTPSSGNDEVTIAFK